MSEVLTAESAEAAESSALEPESVSAPVGVSKRVSPSARALMLSSRSRAMGHADATSERVRADVALKQIKNCTYMAVTHLAGKLKASKSPQMGLLHEMCFAFMKNRNEDVFGKLAEKRARTLFKPISFLGLTFHGRHPEKLPAHFTLLEKSISGRMKGDLNLHGTKSPYLFYRRTDGDEKPITAITLISPDQGEEPPLGYELVRTTAGGRVADINLKAKSPSLFVCFQRGEGPPIVDLAVVHVKQEELSPGWVLCSRLMNGRTPEMDGGRTMIAFKQDFASVILRFQKYERIAAEEGIAGGKYLAKCLGCLMGGIYSFDRNAFLISLEAFTSLDSVTTFPKGMLSEFVMLLRGAVMQYVTAFSRDTYNKVLTWLEHVFKTRANALDTVAFQSIIHMCVFLRHEDARMNMTRNIVTRVIASTKAQRRPPRARARHRSTAKKKKKRAAIGAPPIAPGRKRPSAGRPPTEKPDLAKVLSASGSYSDSGSDLKKVGALSPQHSVTTPPAVEEAVPSFERPTSDGLGLGGRSAADTVTSFLEFGEECLKTPKDSGGDFTPVPSSTTAAITDAMFSFSSVKRTLKCSEVMEASLRKLVCEVSTHVAIIKSTERPLLSFLNAQILDNEFHENTAALIDSLFESRNERFMMAGAFLLAKLSSESLPPKLTQKSESIKRRIHALKLLSFFLENAGSFFKSSVAALAMLRRVVFQSFVYSALSPVPAVFKTMFKMHEILWSHYRYHLKYEIGVLLNTGMVGLLASQNCTPTQKVDLLEGLTNMFKNKSALINIFYNFDNDLVSWPVCAQLVTCVSRLTGGEFAITNHYKLKEDRVVQGALRLLARFMQLMAKYLNAPNLNAGGNLDDQQDFDTLGDDYWEEGGFDYGDSEDVAARHREEAKSAPHSAGTGGLFSGFLHGGGGDEMSLYDMAMLEPTSGTRGRGHDDLSISDGPSTGTSPAPAPLMKSAATGVLPAVSGTEPEAVAKTEDSSQVDDGEEVEDAETKEADGSSEEKKVSSALSEVADAAFDIGVAVGSGGAVKSAWEEAEAKDLDENDLGKFAPTIELGTEEKRMDAVGSPRATVGSAVGSEWPTVGRVKRSGTYAMRYDHHKAQQRIVDEALKKSRPPSGSVKAAVKHLLATADVHIATLKFVAQFLFQNETLDKLQVGEFISALFSSALNQEQHADLRLIYMSLLHFTGMSFDQAFRHFLTDCGFRLPLESQKIDRLVEGFAIAYHRDNPHVFVDSDQGFLLSYGMLMLNTDWHNANARAAAIGGPMSKEAFKTLVHQKENPLDGEMVSALYDSIRENPIENLTMSSMTTYATHVTPSQMEQARNDAVMKLFRGECTKFVQRALGKLRKYSCKYSKNGWLKCNDQRVVRVLFEVTWHQFLAAITTVLRSTEDMATISECLEAIKYSCCTAIMLGLSRPELRAFAEDLSKFVYLMDNKHLKAGVRHLHTVRGEHLKQKWFLKLMSLCEKGVKPLACFIVSRICNDMEQRVIYDKDMTILREIESELQHSIYLVHPMRRFVKQGQLQKQARKGDIMLYTFFLFNDLLIYVSEGRSQGKMVVHRTLRLSLCRTVDLRDGYVRHVKNAFRVISPQKPIILIADNAQEKHEWMSALNTCIEEQLQARNKWAEDNAATLSGLHSTQTMSRYCGREAKPKRHELRRVQMAQALGKSKELSEDVRVEMGVFQRTAPCKLCLRPFKRFARKSRCPWCTDTVCNSCFGRKATPPDAAATGRSKKRRLKVCNACYGAIGYYQSDITQTAVEFSITEASSMQPTLTLSTTASGTHKRPFQR